MESALRHVEILDNLNFHNFKVSVKASDVFMAVEAYRQLARQIEQNTLLGRFGHPSDIADIVHALIAPPGRWLTGQNIEASGGFNF